MTRAQRRGYRRWRERILIIAALEEGERFAVPLSQITGIRPGRLYAHLHELEQEGIIFGAFLDGPEPRRRAYYVACDCGDPWHGQHHRSRHK